VDINYSVTNGKDIVVNKSDTVTTIYIHIWPSDYRHTRKANNGNKNTNTQHKHSI